MASTPNIFTLTRPVVMLYGQRGLFEARAFKDPKTGRTGEPKFDATFVIDADHPDLNGMKQFIVAVGKKAFPGRGFSGPGALGLPISSGTEEADEAQAKGKDKEFLRGKVVLIAKSGEKFPPRLAVMTNGKPADYYGETRGAAQPAMYSGVRVLAEFNFQPYEGFGGGVTAYLNYVLSTNTGDRIGGGGAAEDRFSDYLGSISNVDPSAGLPQAFEDEIPF